MLFEEIMQYNKWTSGIASRELATQRVTLKDLFNKTVYQHPNDVRADKVLPYPIPSTIEQLGDLYIKTNNSIQLFKQSLRNPVIQQNKEAKLKILSIVKRLEIINKILKSIIYTTQKKVAKT